MSQSYLDRTTPPHITTLVIIASTGALAMNVFLPSLPGLARYFDADYAVVQLAVTLYLGATAILQLGIGPASDRFGRRPVMLVCLALFILGSIATVISPTIELLLLARVLQAFGAAGMVLSRAIVRDTVDTQEAASKIGYVTMGMALVPMVAPIIGGFLDELYGWQAAFLLQIAFGLFAFTITYFDLGETNHQRSASMLQQVSTYPELLRSGVFWGYSTAAACTTGTFFALLGGGPYVATEMLDLTPSEYGLYFALVSCGYVLGNYMSGRYARRIGISTMMLIGNMTAISGLVVSIGLFAAGYYHPLSLFGPTLLLGIGNGIALPSINAGIVSVQPRLAGSASGLGGTLQVGGGAAAATLTGALLSPSTGIWPLLWVMLACSIGALVASHSVSFAERRGQNAPGEQDED